MRTGSSWATSRPSTPRAVVRSARFGSTVGNRALPRPSQHAPRLLELERRIDRRLDSSGVSALASTDDERDGIAAALPHSSARALRQHTATKCATGAHLAHAPDRAVRSPQAGTRRAEGTADDTRNTAREGGRRRLWRRRWWRRRWRRRRRRRRLRWKRKGVRPGTAVRRVASRPVVGESGLEPDAVVEVALCLGDVVVGA